MRLHVKVVVDQQIEKPHETATERQREAEGVAARIGGTLVENGFCFQISLHQAGWIVLSAAVNIVTVTGTARPRDRVMPFLRRSLYIFTETLTASRR